MANLLLESGIPVHRHHEYFEAEEDDDVIIRSVAARGWLFICGDKNIDTDHLLEVYQSNAKVVMFSENNSGPRLWTGLLAVNYEKIVDKYVEAGDHPIIIRLGKNGISLTRTHTEIKDRLRRFEGHEIQRQKRGQPTSERTQPRATVTKSAPVRRSGD